MVEKCCSPSTMSLCWFCRNAVLSPETGTGCSWSSRTHTPVKGWEAERRDLKMYRRGYRLVESYRVRACPEFQEG